MSEFDWNVICIFCLFQEVLDMSCVESVSVLRFFA